MPEKNTASTIQVTGSDAFEFLQGQLSNDLLRLEDAASLLTAWCNPKGRVICLTILTRSNGAYSFSVPTELAEDIVSRLTMFRFRAKVDFEITATESLGDPSVAIHAGVPFIGREQSEKFTPHMLNLDLLDAISFDKGCYTGQEIVARTHYKGATRRRTLRFTSTEPLTVGDKVSDGNRDIGEVLNAAGLDLLAVVPVDKADGELTVNEIPLTRQSLPYL